MMGRKLISRVCVGLALSLLNLTEANFCPVYPRVLPYVFQQGAAEQAKTSLTVLFKQLPVPGQGEKIVTGKLPSPAEAFFKATLHNDGSAEYEVFHDKDFSKPAGFRIKQEAPRKHQPGQDFPVTYRQNWQVAALISTITVTLDDPQGKRMHLTINTKSDDGSTLDSDIEFINDIGQGTARTVDASGKVTDSTVKNLIMEDNLAGKWETTDAEKRFLLEISGTTVKWTERGTAITTPGATFVRVVQLGVSGGKFRIERQNDNDALAFTSYKPQSLRDAILAKGPQPSFIVFTRDGDTLTAEWNGIIATKKGDGSLNEVIQPGTRPPKAFTFKRIP